MKTINLRATLFILFLSMGMGAAAQFTVTGNVSDTEAPLIGATVLVKGTNVGTITDFDGNFSVDVPGNEGVLVISYTGYETMEMSVSPGNNEVNVVLAISSALLEEVVVTGYGTATRESLTGAVTTLKSDKLESVPLASVEQILQGNVAGLQANMGNGQPGANVQIRIRGQGSISASSEPLFVIDGIPVASGNLTGSAETSNPLATINPNDIESVNVLKDASATAIYGARAANGVVLITTKSGKSGKPKVNFSAQYGLNGWAVSDSKRLRGLTATEYTDLFLEGELNRGTDLATAIDRFNNNFPDPISGMPAVDITPGADGQSWTLGTVRVDNRWIDELTRTGANQDYNLSVSGGDDKINYFASAGYFKQEAPIIYSQLDRFSGRVNLGIQASDKFKIENNLNVSRTSQQGMNDATRWANPMYNGYLLAPVIPATDASGLFYADHKSFFMGGNNPIGSLSGDDNQEWTMDRFINTISGSYEIIKGLTAKSAWSFDILNYNEFYFRNSRYGDGRNTGGFGRETRRTNTNWIGTQTLTYDFELSDVHNFNVLAGYEAQSTEQRSVSAFGEEFPPNPNLRTLENAAAGDPASSSETASTFESIFARVAYNYDYKYYLQASIRNDGSSRFGVNSRFGNFWAIGASWRLDQEAFMEDVTFIDELKLRTSYGITGNAGLQNFEALRVVAFSEIDYAGSPGGAPTQIGNSDLTWEESKVFNIGLDFAILNNGLSGTIEFFNRESDNLLLDVPVSRTTGFRSAIRNFGAMRNRGVEITLNAPIVSGDKLNVSLGGNITFLKNKITKLDEPFRAGTHDRFLREEGRDYNEYNVFDWAGVNPDDGAPLWYTDETRGETTSSISEAEQFFIGKSGNPDFFGGFNGLISYGNFSVDANFTFSWDNWLYDATAWVLQGDGRFTPRSQTNLVLDRWQNPGDVTNVPKFQWGNRSNSNQRGSSRWLNDGTHIRLRNLTVGYNIPRDLLDKASIASARVYFRGTNMLTWTRDGDLYLDPEADVNGFVNSPVPNLKTLSFGIDLGF
ncbi:MAG: TonB-dependent receptor [Saprospiraceae bacterium]|nr:TonB-dependent receptor [Saprospiraceae bacterium]